MSFPTALLDSSVTDNISASLCVAQRDGQSMPARRKVGRSWQVPAGNTSHTYLSGAISCFLLALAPLAVCSVCFIGWTTAGDALNDTLFSFIGVVAQGSFSAETVFSSSTSISSSFVPTAWATSSPSSDCITSVPFSIWGASLRSATESGCSLSCIPTCSVNRIKRNLKQRQCSLRDGTKTLHVPSQGNCEDTLRKIGSSS